MPRITACIFTLLVLITSTGCSVFGVATRNELDAALLQERAERQQTDARLEALGQRLELVADQLEDLDRRLRPRLASLDSALIRTAAEVAMVTERWDALRTELTSDLDSLNAGYDAVLVDLAAIQNDLGVASVSARDARSRSERALQLHRDAISWERDRLQRRLHDLESRLLELDAVTDSSEVSLPEPPRPEGRGEISRHTPSP